jgi:GxxExxY protein
VVHPEADEEQRKRLNDLSRKVIGLCIEIHRELGPGLLESVYEECLAYELSRIGLRYERQQPLPVRYKVVDLNCGYRLDFVVDDAVIVELKAVTDLHPIHEAQLLTYLRLARKIFGPVDQLQRAGPQARCEAGGVRRLVQGGFWTTEAPRHGEVH